MRHVFRGEITRRGKPVGFDSTIVQLTNAKVDRICGQPDRYGIFDAEVAIRRNTKAPWQTKTSSMFTDQMSKNAVTAAILLAYRNSKEGKKFEVGQGAALPSKVISPRIGGVLILPTLSKEWIRRV